MKLLNRVIDGILPMPAVLAAALRAGTVRIAKADSGQVAYVVAPHCPNKEAVRKAVDKRHTWELAATVAICSAVIVALGAVAQLLIQ